MGSIDAYSSLISSDSDWNDYLSKQSGLIDLKLSDLKNKDLSHRNLSNCNFSGADFENTNLDGCVFANSIFDNCCMENTSIVNGTLSSSSFRGTNMKKIVFRNTVMRNLDFDNVNFEGSELKNSEIISCNFKDSKLSSITLQGADFEDSKFIEVKGDDFNIEDCDFKRCDFNRVHFSEGVAVNSKFRIGTFYKFTMSSSSLDSISFINSGLDEVGFSNSAVSHLDFTDSAINNSDLAHFNLSDSIFLNTAFNKCNWPIQSGTTSFFGKYVVSDNLIGQPVQDLKGLYPSFRRKIADAQFLREMFLSRSWSKNILFRIWGFTTNYGQSLIRLVFVALALIVLLSILFSFSTISSSSLFIGLTDSVTTIAYAFIGADLDNGTIFSSYQTACIFISRTSGFIILGLWIGLAANKVGRLSSE